jgi:hypothetical protein
MTDTMRRQATNKGSGQTNTSPSEACADGRAAASRTRVLRDRQTGYGDRLKWSFTSKSELQWVGASGFK